MKLARTFQKDAKNPAAPGRHAETEALLKLMGFRFKLQPDGTYVAHGEVNLNLQGLTVLPDFSRVHIKGAFKCANNKLVSLTGAPLSVTGYFGCSGNNLTSLEGAPVVMGDFACEGNPLGNLFGLKPDCKKVSSDFGEFEDYTLIPRELLRDIEGGKRALAICDVMQNDMLLEPGNLVLNRGRIRLKI
jgi:hypothetical protein